MSGRQLVETDIALMQTQIQTNIVAALAAVSATRADNKVATDAPKDYYIYPKAKGYRTPCVFLIADDVDFRKRERGQNHINATNKINVSVLIEDKDAERLTRKAYRYQAALHQVLDQVTLTSSDLKVKITIVVARATFSPLYTDTTDPTAPNAVFRKEVVLECEIEHYESFA